MSEGFIVDGSNGEIAGIVVRQAAENGFCFHASASRFEPMDGHVFASPAAAQRAAREFDKCLPRRAKRATTGELS